MIEIVSWQMSIGIIWSIIYLIGLVDVFFRLKKHYKYFNYVTVGDVVEELLMNLNPFRAFGGLWYIFEGILDKISFLMNIKILDNREKK